MSLVRVEARVFIEEVIEISESEITPDKYESESDILLLLTGQGNAESYVLIEIERLGLFGRQTG